MCTSGKKTSSKQRNPIALVTGGTSGIGLSACKQLAERGLDVILTCRSAATGERAIRDIQAHIEETSRSPSKHRNVDFQVRYIQMELDNLSAVSRACEQILREEPNLDYLLLNAGIMGDNLRKEPSMSADGIESTVAVNHVAGYFLAHKLLPLMQRTARKSFVVNGTIKPMITFVSSDIHNSHSVTGAAKSTSPALEDNQVRFLADRLSDKASTRSARIDGLSIPKVNGSRSYSYYDMPYSSNWAYKYSKMLNVLTAQAIHDSLSSRNDVQDFVAIGCNSMEPGFIPQSELSRDIKKMAGSVITKVVLFLIYNGPLCWFIRWILGQPVRTLEEGGYSEVYACLEGSSGTYYRLDQPEPPTPLAKEPRVVRAFYKATNLLLREKGFPVPSLATT